MKDFDVKKLRKAAFAVGFGFTMGKFVAKLVDCAFDGAVRSVMKFEAKEGNEFAQRVCDEAGLEYEEKSGEEREPEIKMGFHCE